MKIINDWCNHCNSQKEVIEIDDEAGEPAFSLCKNCMEYGIHVFDKFKKDSKSYHDYIKEIIIYIAKSTLKGAAETTADMNDNDFPPKEYRNAHIRGGYYTLLYIAQYCSLEEWFFNEIEPMYSNENPEGE